MLQPFDSSDQPEPGRVSHLRFLRSMSCAKRTVKVARKRDDRYFQNASQLALQSQTSTHTLLWNRVNAFCSARLLICRAKSSSLFAASRDFRILLFVLHGTNEI